MNVYDLYTIAKSKNILSSEETMFHESIGRPNAEGKQCFKAWGYYDKISWITKEQQDRWLSIDRILQDLIGGIKK